MSEVTLLLKSVELGDSQASQQLLSLVYEELRELARARMARESPGHTLQPTALVHEAYLRLVGDDPERRWDGRGHFFAAAAEAMRRILIEHARRKRRKRRGGDLQRIELDVAAISTSPTAVDELLQLDESLDKLAAEDRDAAELVKMRYFLGLSLEEAAKILKISRSTAYRRWTYARAWLRCEIREAQHEPPE